MIRAMLILGLVLCGISDGGPCKYKNDVLISGGATGDVDGSYYIRYTGDRSVQNLKKF